MFFELSLILRDLRLDLDPVDAGRCGREELVA